MDSLPRESEVNRPGTQRHNYTLFFEENVYQNQNVPRVHVNNKITIKTLETKGDYVEHKPLEENQYTKLRFQRNTSYNIANGLRNIVLGASTWRNDVEKIIAAIDAKASGIGEINSDGIATSNNSRPRTVIAYTHKDRLDKLRKLLLEEYNRESMPDLEIESRQIDLCRKLINSTGTKFQITYNRAFALKDRKKVLSTDAFMYDIRQINIYRVLFGNVLGQREALHSIALSSIIGFAEHQAKSHTDKATTETLLYPNASVLKTWAELSSYGNKDAFHVSARLVLLMLEMCNF